MEEPLFQLTEFVRRPGLGSEGKHIKVRANFFEVLQLPQASIIHYDVTITPDVPPQLNRRVFERFVELNRNGALGGTRPVYDGIYTFFF
jgi:hypothetical protein